MKETISPWLTTGSGLPLLALTTNQACEVLGISRPTIWRLEQRGLLLPSRAMRHPRWLVADIVEFLESSKGAA